MHALRLAVLAPLAAAVAGLSALAGCGEKQEAPPAAGGGATEKGASAGAVPEAQPLGRWILAADGLCSDSMAEQEATRRKQGGRQVTLADRARLLVGLAPSRERLAGDLAALTPPDRQRAASRRLVATAERRARASTEAGRLYERGADRAAIAAAAAAEHDERERFVEIASRLGMKDCAEVLSAADAREVIAAVEQGLGPGGAGERCEAFGRRFLEERYGGGIEACVAAGASGYATGTVEVGATEGIDGVFALAPATVGDPGGESQSYRVRLTYEDGGYKIDKLD